MSIDKMLISLKSQVMKRNVICIVTITICIGSHGYSQSNNSVPDNVRAANAVDAIIDFTVSPGFLLYGIPEVSGEVVGSAYLNNEWKKCTLKHVGKNKEFIIPECKVNLYSNQIEVNYNNAMRAIDGFKVESFVLTNEGEQVYKNASAFKINGVPQVGFLEVLVDGNNPLYKKTEVRIKKPDYNIALNVGSKNTKIIKEESLYMAQGYELVNVKSIKNKKFSLIFGDTASSVEKFIGENSLRLSQEADLILIFQYANDALKKKEGT
jgi:hypothetical protein